MTATVPKRDAPPRESAPRDSAVVGELPVVSKRDQVLAQINAHYALVLLGDRPAVMEEVTGVDGRPEIRFLSVAGFHEWMRPLLVWERDEAGNSRRVQMSKAWVESPKRRQYEGIVFDPTGTAPATYYNLWRGFPITPSPAGSCQRFLDHVAENVCAGDEALFAWVMGWFAQLVQHPTKKLGTALVLRGGQGTGKTFVGDTIGSLLGPHYALVSDPRYIVGRFNSHLANCLLLQLDEATWGGDHTAAGKLKDLITSDWQYIEYKGKEPVKVRNHVRLFITGNNNWLVPAGIDERRFAVLDVGDAKQQDHAYFQAIADELTAGGREHLLHYLLTYDTRDIPLRQVPNTGALMEQKVSSLAPEQGWWLDVLRRGQLPGDREGSGDSEVGTLHRDYIERLKDLGVQRRLNEWAFGIALHRFAPGMGRKRRTVVTLSGSDRRYVYEFPPLADCRRAFARIIGDTDLSPDDDAPETWQPDKRKEGSQ